MRIIIAGAGDVGSHLAKMLSNEGHEITVIDPVETRLKGIDATMDILTLVGSATSFEILKEAKVKNADLFIAVAHSEDINITSAILGKHLGVKKTIARVDNPEYLLPSFKDHFTNLGIDYLIYPERIAASELVGLLHQSETTEYFDFSGGKLSLFVFKLDEKAPIINRTLGELTKKDQSMDYRTIAITRNGKTFIPRGDDIFLLNDMIYVVSTRSGVEEIFHQTGKEKHGIKNLMILGGSRIGKKTALELQRTFNIKLIDIDKEKCELLADVLEDTLVINGDGRDTDLLCEEGLKNMDAFVAVTGNSEMNILSCLFAQKIGVKKTIAEIENIQYIGLAENIGVDTVINKKLTTASKIFRFTMRAEVSRIKYLTVSDAEVLEFVVKEGAEVTSGPLKKIGFPKDASIGGIIRGKSAFIAKGDTEIRPNDRAVVFALPTAINKIEKFFVPARMINYKIIVKVLGTLIFLEGIFMLIGVPFTLYYGDSDLVPLLLSSLITILSGAISRYITRKAEPGLGRREGYIIVSIGWILFSVFGSLPFIISGAIPSFTDAFFETISGFTTTGASILNDIEAMPHGLLVWRSMTQWLGGMGIIVLSVAIMPLLGVGGMQLFVAEVPGPAPDKLHPRVKDTAIRLWAIYIIFTGVETVLLLFGGMNFFDAICHSFTTMATGGYSTKQLSIAYYASPYIQYVITFFMFLAGTNFTLSYFALHLRFDKVWKNEEFRFYLGFVFLAIILVMGGLLITSDLPVEKSFRNAAFQVVSIITTTGYVTTDYALWSPFLIIFLLILMFSGGSAGSTGGSVKMMRILLLLKNGLQELKRLIHPKAVIPVRFNHKAVSSEIISNILAFVVFYMVITALGVVVMGLLGCDLESAFGSVAATLGNIGPGIGKVGPAENYYFLPDIGKWFLSFLMLLGRLEIFTVLVLFSPAFWKK